jgi:hypothetical protein
MNKKQKDLIIKKYDLLVGDLMLRPSKEIYLLERFRDWLMNYLEEITSTEEK